MLIIGNRQQALRSKRVHARNSSVMIENLCAMTGC
jgi:hypothetical protein